MLDRNVVTAAEWRDWKEHPVTKLFNEEMLEQIGAQIQSLVLGAGIDPPADRFSVGKISGLTELSDWKPQIVEDRE